MRSLRPLPLVLLAAMATVPGRAQQSAVVAEVGDGHRITVAELADYAEDRLYPLRFPDRATAYREALHDRVTDELKRIDLFASGLHRDEALMRSIGRSVTEELVLLYFQREYQDDYLNEEAIRREYEDAGRVVVYRQIVLPKPQGASAEAIEALRTTVGEIQRQIEAGAAFEALVRRYSQGASADAGGLAAPVRWQHALTYPRDYVIFHLAPGETRSFEAPDRFEVVQVERVEDVPMPPLPEVRDRLVEVIQGRHAAAAAAAFAREKAATIDTTAMRWDPDGLAQVVAWSNTPGFYEGAYRDVLGRHLADHGDALVWTDGRGEVRLSDLRRLLDEVLILGRSGGHDEALVRDFLLEAVRTERIAEHARTLGLDDELLRPDTPSTVLASAFVRLYNQRHVEEQIPDTTAQALRAFYEAHADSLFYQLEVVNVEAIVRTDEEAIEAVWEQVQAGVPFEEVSSRRLVRSFVRTREGEIDSYLSREPPYLGEVAFELAEGEVAGPVSYVDADGVRQHAVVKAVGHRPERQLRYDEVRGRVAEAFVEHHRARLAAEVAADLRERYDVEVDEERWARVLSDPQ